MRKKNWFWLLIFFCVLISACKKINELEEAEITGSNAEFALPLFKAKTSLQNLLENFDQYTHVEIHPDGTIHLRYKGNVLTHGAREYIVETLQKLPPLIPLTDTLYTLPFSAPQQLEVDFATYKSGKVSLAVISDYVGKVNLKVTFIHMLKNGEPMTLQTEFQSPVGTEPFFFYYPPEKVDCAGYHLVPQNGEAKIRYEAFTETGQRIKLKSVALVNQNVDFSYIEGFLGNFRQKGKLDKIAIEFFENWIQGDIFFEKPVIEILIENSFGVPTRSGIEIFDILTADGRRIPLQSEFITERGIDFPYPTMQEVGETSKMLFTFNAENSNIEEVLGARPVGLEYKVDAIMNPDNVANQRGFVTDSSFYKIQVEVDLPLHGRAFGFLFLDTFQFNPGNYGNIKEAEFKIVADNQMPIAIEGQLYFLDNNNLVLDSLFPGKTLIVSGAPVNDEGFVVAKGNRTNFITFSSERFERIRPAKKMVLKSSFSTTGQGQRSVKAMAGQEAEIRLGMKIKSR